MELAVVLLFLAVIFVAAFLAVAVVLVSGVAAVIGLAAGGQALWRWAGWDEAAKHP